MAGSRSTAARLGQFEGRQAADATIGGATVGASRRHTGSSQSVHSQGRDCSTGERRAEMVLEASEFQLDKQVVAERHLVWETQAKSRIRNVSAREHDG